MELISGIRSNGLGGTEIDRILAHLSVNLTHLVGELVSLRAQSDEKVLMYGPFLARGFLEVAFTAIIARLDPFRVLTIQRVQLSPSYESTIPWRSAIRWQGDVVAQKVKDMWGSSVDPKEMSRALFSDYADELVWRPALQVVSDALPLAVTSRWLSEMLATPVDSFCAKKRETVNGLYSRLSKSVHFESVTPVSMLSDRVTTMELIARTTREVAELALLSHYVPHAYGSLSTVAAFDAFYKFEELEVF